MRSLWWLTLGAVVACAAADAEAPVACRVQRPLVYRQAPHTSVSPTQLDVLTDSTGDLTATVTENCGADVLDTVTVTWVSRDASVATVASTGAQTATVTGVAPGATWVTATYGEASDSAHIIVADVPAVDTFPCVASATTMTVGDDWQAKVDAQGTGTTFTICGGVHRMQSVTPKTNDIFIGETGAVMSGARVLTGWTAVSGAWYVGGQTQHNTTVGVASCGPGYPLCHQPEDLWIDDVWQTPVSSLAAVSSGKWFFDYAADRIYVGSDPTSATVETSVSTVAFASATGVTIKHLTVERYANGDQHACVNAASGTVDSNEVRECHGIGIRTTGTSNQRGNYVHHNLQMGAAATGTPTITGNRWEYNNWLQVFGAGSGEECGGIKLVSTISAVVRADTARYNGCNGIWTDVNPRNTLIRKSVADSNHWAGILSEVAYGERIDSNTVRYNGWDAATYAVAGAGIIIANTRNDTVAFNTLVNNKHGIMGYDTDRSSPTPPGGYGTHDVVGMVVTGNDVTQTNGGRAAGIADLDPLANPYTAGNLWSSNAYTCTGTTKWRWSPNADVSKANWLAVPQDAGSSFSGC